MFDGGDVIRGEDGLTDPVCLGEVHVSGKSRWIIFVSLPVLFYEHVEWSRGTTFDLKNGIIRYWDGVRDVQFREFGKKPSLLCPLSVRTL
jgi:hypothetical protein